MTRTNELKKLDSIFQSNDSNLVLMYGRLGSSKETLLGDFTTGKTYFYYRSRQCSDEKQLCYLDGQINQAFASNTKAESFDDCFKKFRS